MDSIGKSHFHLKNTCVLEVNLDDSIIFRIFLIGNSCVLMFFFERLGPECI